MSSRLMEGAGVMNVWLIILLQFLPLLLEWLLKHKGKLKPSEVKRLNGVLWYTGRIENTAVRLGCQRGGVNPEE